MSAHAARSRKASPYVLSRYMGNRIAPTRCIYEQCDYLRTFVFEISASGSITATHKISKIESGLLAAVN
jgi:hypothetical protein